MRFKVGDKVRIIATSEQLMDINIAQDIIGKETTVKKTCKTTWGGVKCRYKLALCGYEVPGSYLEVVEATGCDACSEHDLLLHCTKSCVDKASIRTFETGATRDTDHGKLDYEGFLSPVVLTRYAEYLNKHRIQSDGKLRDSDNWQKLFGEKHEQVCMKSAWRHFMAVWKCHRGYKCDESIEDSICAVIFNMMAYLYKIERDKHV